MFLFMRAQIPKVTPFIKIVWIMCMFQNANFFLDAKLAHPLSRRIRFAFLYNFPRNILLLDVVFPQILRQCSGGHFGYVFK